MNPPPKVSVILTSYNHAKYLRDAIDSVCSQTFSDFELIIWDDASTDESWQIISSYTDPRIRSFRNQNNLRGGNVRRAIEQAVRGRYIAVHHSDDVWEPQKLEKQVAFLDSHSEIGAVFSWAQIIDENGQRFTNETHFYYKIFEQPNRTRFEWLNHFFYHGNALCHPSVLIRKQAYDDCGLYRYGFAQSADYDMWVRLCLRYDIHILPEKLVRFRIRAMDMNVSGDRPDAKTRTQFEHLQVLNNYRNIDTPDFFLLVFPDAKKYSMPDGMDIGYALGMIALEANLHKFTELFGLQLLFEALNERTQAEKIEKLYGFTPRDFINLTAKYDVFSFEAADDFRKQVIEKEQLIQALTVHLNNSQQELASFRQIKILKLVLLFRRLGSMLVPDKKMTPHIFWGNLVLLFEKIKEKIKRHNTLKKEAALIRSSVFFDESWYLANNTDVDASKVEPVYHYLLFGGFERRNPGLSFDSGWYLDTNKDVKESGINPLVHYLQFGRQEGRAARPDKRVETLGKLHLISGEVEASELKKTYDTAVILHLYYTDLFDEISEYLQNLGHFDLYISMLRANREYVKTIYATFPEAKIYFVENRGRDVLPFLAICKTINSLDYRYYLKIHTKKSPHREDGSTWRTDVYRKLIGSEEIIHSIKATFDHDQTVGIIGPKGHIIDYRTYTWKTHRPQVEDLAAKIGINIREDQPYSFVAGLMFWAKPEALRYLELLPIDFEDFEPEPLSPDGALVHAVERLIGLATEETGYTIYETDETGQITETGMGLSKEPYPFGVPDPLGIRHRLALFARRMRLWVFPVGSRRELVARILVEAVKNPRSPLLPPKVRLFFSLITPDYLSDKLEEHLINDEYLISLSHDDYTRIVGGIQLVVLDEQIAYNKLGMDYLHIYPFITNPRLIRKYEPLILGINCNGKQIGALNSDDFLRVMRKFKSKRLVNILIHHTLGFEINFLHRILNEVGDKKGRFWLHDNFSICQNYTLLRNDQEYCGAPDVNSETCLTCKYGHARRLQQPVFRKLFENNLLEVVAPSQFTLDLWEEKSTYTEVYGKVAPHLSLSWKGTLPSRAPEAPIRIGFVGYPVYWKGWETWLRLINKFSRDSRYQFYFFSSWTRISDEMKWVNVSVTKNNRLSMVESLRNNHIDVTFLWSLCPETFSFTLYESLSAGCYILTYKDSGNIQAYIKENADRGLIFRDESALFELFTSDGLNTIVTNYQKDGRPQGELTFSSSI